MSTAARIDELRKKFEENPRRFFAPLANELRKAGDLTQAIALCREHLPKQPGHMSGYIVFGQALYESGELDEARVVFEQALALDPENLIALHHLGHIARQVGDTASARRWYERALETDPRNDDIAHHLAALATPIRPMAAIKTPSVAMPSVAMPSVAVRDEADPEPPAGESVDSLDVLALGAIPSRRDLGAIATPPYPQNAVGDLPLAPTPDAAMRAVDFDQVNASLRNPESHAFFDLEAIESVGNAMGTERDSDDVDEGQASAPETNAPIDISFDDPEDGVLLADDSSTADAVVDLPMIEVSGQAMADDPFGFDEEDVVTALTMESVMLEAPEAPQVPDNLAVEFEEGLVTADWPDTTDFTLRQPTPRSVTPLSVDVTPDAVEAFGREPEDPVVAPLPAPEPDVLGEEADLVAAPSFATPVFVASVMEASTPEDQVVSLEEAMPVEEALPVDALQEAPWQDAAPVTAADEVDEVVSLADPREELPWLAASGTPTDDVAAIVLAMEADARASGEADEVFFDDRSDEEEAQATEPAPAFVTETMGELLVAQGFVDRAVVVYEELVRRRPYDPVLSARLEELREQLTAATPVSLYTARERFALLAARRVPRRTPPRAATPIASPSVTPLFTATHTPAFTPAFTPAAQTPSVSAPPMHETAADSLSTLFGTASEPQDDDAAQALAEAFAPMQVEAGSVVDQFAESFFGDPVAPREPTPAYGAPRQPTPSYGASTQPTPAADFSFDRFFPDPAAGAPATPSSGTPAGGTMAEAEPSARTSDDLAQFSAWLKGLGNS